MNKISKYLVLKEFNSTIFKNLLVPKGAIIEETIPNILYYKRKPVGYTLDILKNSLCKNLD